MAALAVIAIAATPALSGTTSGGVGHPAVSSTAEVIGELERRPITCNLAALRHGVRFYRSATWRWQTQRDASTTRSSFSDRRSRSCAYVRWVADLWITRAREARREYSRWLHVTYEKWGCIHREEAAWNDQGAPHYGGLQFDGDFQLTYGREFVRRWGDAGNWPVWAQLITAERAYRGYGGYGPRGFGPWPNTARECGLL